MSLILPIVLMAGHLGFTAFGIFVLSRGRVDLSKTAHVKGRSARAIGIVCVLSYPMSWALGFLFGLYWGAVYPEYEELPFWGTAVVNLGAWVIIGVSLFVISRNEGVRQARRRSRR